MAHTVKLRTDIFGKAMRLAGFRSDYGMAKAMGINRSTIARVVSGELGPGPVFIASALTVLAPMQFHDLFEIVPTTKPPPNPDAETERMPHHHDTVRPSTATRSRQVAGRLSPSPPTATS